GVARWAPVSGKAVSAWRSMPKAVGSQASWPWQLSQTGPPGSSAKAPAWGSRWHERHVSAATGGNVTPRVGPVNVIEIAASSRAPWQLAQSIRPWAPTRAKPVWASWSNRSASNELLICCQPAVVWHVAQSVPKAPSWASSWHDWQEACSTPSNWRRGPLPGWQLAQAMAAWAPVSGKPVRAWLKLGVVPHVALPWHEEHSWPRNWPPWGLSSAWQPRQLVERPSKRAAPRPA